MLKDASSEELVVTFVYKRFVTGFDCILKLWAAQRCGWNANAREGYGFSKAVEIQWQIVVGQPKLLATYGNGFSNAVEMQAQEVVGAAEIVSDLRQWLFKRSGEAGTGSLGGGQIVGEL